MRRALLAAAAALVLAPATPAVAGSTADAGCGFRSVTDESWIVGEPYVYHGVAYGYGVVHTTTGSPAGATVTCAILVNGELAATVDFSGTGVMAGAGPVTFRLQPLDFLGSCVIVDFDDETPTRTRCHTIGGPTVPPHEIREFVTAVVETLPGAAVVCAAIADGTMPTQGRLLWTQDGDLYVSQARVRDCPPHN